MLQPSDIHHPHRPLISQLHDERRWCLVYGNEWSGHVGAVNVNRGVTSPMRTMLARTFCAAQGASLRFAFCVDIADDGSAHIFVGGDDVPEDFAESMVRYVFNEAVAGGLDVEQLQPPLLFEHKAREPVVTVDVEDWRKSVAEARENLVRGIVSAPQTPAGATGEQGGTDAPAQGEDGRSEAPAGTSDTAKFERVPDGGVPLTGTLKFFDQFETKAQLDTWAAVELDLVLDARKNREGMVADILRSGRFVLVDDNGNPVEVAK